MKFLILRQLQHSELGMFHAYRRSGREGSRQRAINFDGEVVDRVFPVAEDTDRIALNLRYDTDEGPLALNYFLKRQGKNWRLEGNCPEDQLYHFVEPDCLFAMEVDAGVQPAVGAWVVFPRDDPTALAILADGATSGLARASMIALEVYEAPRIHKFLTQARPDLFNAPSLQDLDMTNTTFPPEPVESPKPAGRRLPPGPTRLPTMLSASGHNFVSAVADIIDNAISADATEIQITFDPPNSGNGRWMTIRDNGRGMSSEQLEEAIRIGGEADYDGRSLGKYGFGLKGASWSQARNFKVVTRQKGGEVHHLGWDQDTMVDWQVDERPLEDWEVRATDPGEHGTVVLWKNMKAPTTAPSIKGVSPHVAEIQELNRHLGLVFHRFLDGDAKGRAPLKIWINNIPVESNGPAGHPLSERHDLKTLKVEHEGGSAEVKVQPIVLPSEDELRKHHGGGWQAATDRIGYWGRRNDTQGLFLYRNDRLIRWGGWHDLWATNDEKTKLARVLVDFDPALDEAFQINISKQTVRLPGYLQSRIKPLADTVRKASQAKYRKSRPTPPPRALPLQVGPASEPGAFSEPSGPAVPGASTPPPQPPAPTPPITVRKVTTGKFAWRIATDLRGSRSLQIGDVSPALVELASALGTSDVGTEALAAFLEELDRLDLQQMLIDDAADA
ncbi:ATP-binding protein [Mesorhizobium sp. AR02]|uniref:ATP-binding protein n=1 Tax=Mesorhizobium sp. AR02 TaxID=2865837 RepID=UPI002160D59A|nr:ATP-binding protein [Mesorhizobium sp. AR02]UVK55608.1 ATP-binding protein [Mesorhizobium sp. AR02]